MKITKQKLRNIINEEYSKIKDFELEEGLFDWMGHDKKKPKPESNNEYSGKKHADIQSKIQNLESKIQKLAGNIKGATNFFGRNKSKTMNYSDIAEYMEILFTKVMEINNDISVLTQGDSWQDRMAGFGAVKENKTKDELSLVVEKELARLLESK